MEGADEQGSDVRAVGEEPERDDGAGGDGALDEGEEGDCEGAEDDETQDGGGAPGPGHAAELEAEEQHDGAADDGERAEPVDRAQAFPEGGFGRLEVEVEQDYDERGAVEGDWLVGERLYNKVEMTLLRALTVDVEAPTP